MDVKSVDVYRDELLSEIDDSYDKSQGFIVFDMFKAIAHAIQSIYVTIAMIIGMMDIENLSGEVLERYVYQRKGIVRKPATYAIGSILVTGNGTANTGDIFESKSGIQFRATETILIDGSGYVKIECLESGVVGNLPADQINAMPVTIPGITSVTNENQTADGFEKESDPSLRERYLEAVRTPATSGNKHHYREWANSVAGVGDAKVLPLERGDNTLEVVTIDSDKTVASPEIVSVVQLYIDPDSNGKGEGAAPIGAHCYVVPATALNININLATVTLSGGLTKADVEANISAAMIEYLKDQVAFKSDEVSYAKVGRTIIDAQGVDDYTGLTVNGGTVSVLIGLKEVPVLGGVVIA